MPTSPSCASRSQLSHLAAELTKVRNQYFFAKVGLDEDSSDSKQHESKIKKNNLRCRKENVRTAAGNDRACQSDLLSAAFEVQRCKGDEVKSTLCLCDLFSYHFLWGLLRGSKTSWHFGRLHYGLEKKTNKKKKTSLSG